MAVALEAAPASASEVGDTVPVLAAEQETDQPEQNAQLEVDDVAAEEDVEKRSPTPTLVGEIPQHGANLELDADLQAGTSASGALGGASAGEHDVEKGQEKKDVKLKVEPPSTSTPPKKKKRKR